MEPQTQATKKLNETMDELTTLRDEIRLNLHLAGMEAKSEWDELQPRLLELETRFEQGSQKATKLASEVRAALRSLRDRVRSPRVAEVMSAQVFTAKGGDSLHRALALMWDHDCGALPVIDDTGKAIGIITDRDIAMAAYTRGKLDMGAVVYTVQSNALFTCAPNDALDSTMNEMRTRGVRRLPVVDANGALVGMLSLGDIARWAAENQSKKLLEQVATTFAAISRPRK